MRWLKVNRREFFLNFSVSFAISPRGGVIILGNPYPPMHPGVRNSRAPYWNSFNIGRTIILKRPHFQKHASIFRNILLFRKHASIFRNTLLFPETHRPQVFSGQSESFYGYFKKFRPIGKFSPQSESFLPKSESSHNRKVFDEFGQFLTLMRKYLIPNQEVFKM